MTQFICVSCPLGCLLKIEDNNISGHACPRGLDYARLELTDPKRNIAGTVRILGAIQNMLPVKTSEPLPKALLLDAARLLDSITVSSPIKIGDVIIENIFGTGVNFVATRSL